jgi:hypothetical protein
MSIGLLFVNLQSFIKTVFKQNSYIHKVFSLTSVPLLITSHIKLNADHLLILILAPDGFYAIIQISGKTVAHYPNGL